MPQRFPINEEQLAPLLRRSPRLFQKNQIKTESATNKNPNTYSPSSSTPKVTLKKKTLKHQPQQSPQKLNNSRRKSIRLSEKRTTEKESEQKCLLGFRKSELGNEALEQFTKKSANRSCKNGNSNAKIITAVKTGKGKGSASIRCTSIKLSTQRGFPGEFENRVTRSSSEGKRSENTENASHVNCNGPFGEDDSTQISKRRRLSVRGLPKAEAGVKSSKQSTVKLENKRQKKSHEPGQRSIRSSIKANELIQCDTAEILDEGRSKLGAGTSLMDIENGGERKEDKYNHRGNKQIGVKRKRNKVEKDKGIVIGWNSDQELALQRAYLATKPTPHFWKKVSRLVPGKSAQECFDKVHSDHLTPPQHLPRTRARTNSSSSLVSFSLSASDLLKSPVLIVKNKRKSHLSHKTVRQLLQKSYQVDPNYEADLFSVLESTSNPSPVLSTPERKPESLLKKCLQKSNSLAKKKQVSRFSREGLMSPPVLKQVSRFSREGLVSPPVLKQVKNKVLHEKYLDQLRSREAKRKAASSRAIKCRKKEERMVGHAEKIDAIKAAKNALVFDARDVINQFQNMQANASISDEEDKDEYEYEYEEEDEDRG